MISDATLLFTKSGFVTVMGVHLSENTNLSKRERNYGRRLGGRMAVAISSKQKPGKTKCQAQTSSAKRC